MDANTNMYIYVNFAPNPKFTERFIAVPSNGGTITPIGTGRYLENSWQALTATPGVGYRFVHWINNDEDDSPFSTPATELDNSTADYDITSLADTTMLIGSPMTIWAIFAPSQTSTTTTVTCLPNPVSTNSPITFTATVAGSGSNPTGTITWSSSSSTGHFSSIQTSSTNGVATVTYTDSSAGSPTIIASYGGDSFNTASSGQATIMINPSSTTTSITSSQSANAGQIVTFTVNIAGNNPTGTITWSSTSSTGVFTSTQTTLINGAASVTYSVHKTGH